MKIAVITCYHDPNYVRARTLRAGLKNCLGVETIVIKNKQHGLLRYPEIIGKIIVATFKEKPDVYLLTFRGYEILPFLLLVAGRKPVIFDEFINLTEWVVDEHQKISANGLAAKMLNWWYGRLLRRCRFILADTQAHAEYSATRSGIDIKKYRAIPVGTDETVFYSHPIKPKPNFRVFYYGNMLPLHGLNVAVAAAEKLKSRDNISFLFVGGGDKAEKLTTEAIRNGANIEYRKWINFDRLPETISDASLCLAGPFGNTVQSQLVVTGKTYQFLASGAPTVIGKNAASNLFIDQQNTLVVPQGNPTALAQSISWAADHPQELVAIAARGRALFKQEFSTKIITDRLNSLVAELR